MNTEWIDQSEFPGELNSAHNGFSVDVLVYSEQLDEHAVGFYDFKTMTWRFFADEQIKKFKWRYFQDEIDKHKSTKPNKNEKKETFKESKQG